MVRSHPEGKDDLHFAKRLYYAKVFAKQASFISLKLLPYFIAAQERDVFFLYGEGQLTLATKRIYEFLRENGSTPTGNLRSGTWLSGKENKSGYERAMDDLQRRFIVCKVGLTGRIRGNYGYIWDLTEAWLPELVKEASRLERGEAKRVIWQKCERGGLSLGPAALAYIFGWEKSEGKTPPLPLFDLLFNSWYSYFGSCVHPESSSCAVDFSEYAAFPFSASLLTTDEFLIPGLSLVSISSIGGIKCIV